MVKDCPPFDRDGPNRTWFSFGGSLMGTLRLVEDAPRLQRSKPGDGGFWLAWLDP
jgi:hypothetical protein